MAVTKKALEIQIAKSQVSKEIMVVRAQIRAACGRIPAWIAAADATKSVEWRDRAGAELVRTESFPLVSERRSSLSKLRDILAGDLLSLSFLSAAVYRAEISEKRRHG